ncbi:cytochrome C assembly family protein [Microbulbifer agarilyticus]|uniref:cytochrome C assembly family protein n=1 Tax=Microbulbifer agarilyticus TaxID=260552 RepID=UPI001C97CF1C|nr:cytochrome c biogenesis protein CcsA [Microbulbifer agarilyticus]MBY6189795.1 cytochrome c biogenesis protein CcsA [Microbulbifer agarilyticus]MCA0892326.1 cytochrome c biogenesis protein CcsA [Microbulbifer agarilyticus]MCA0900644.1 cytochrome c biogenesis protein CcsA [Microbulbifer agarilyticus]
MAAFAHWMAIALYIATTGVAAATLYRQPQNTKQPLLLGLFAGALVAHGLSLSHTLLASDGFRFDLLAVMSLITWTVGLLLLLLSLRHKLTLLILVIAPLAALALIGAQHAWSGPTPRAEISPGIAAHAFFSIAAYSLLTLATLQAIYLYWLNQQLHNHRPGGISRFLPPLQTMESLLFGLIAFGQLLLTAALITGALFVDDLFGQQLVHKTTLSIFAWILYSILLWGHWKKGWRGNTAVRWTLSAFAVLMLAFFGSKLALEVFLPQQ